MDSVTKLEENLPGRYIDKIVIFNKNCLQKWRFHIETRVLVGKTSEINNSGIFSVSFLYDLNHYEECKFKFVSCS